MTKIAVYDAVYLAAAIQQHCAFITADQSLARHLNKQPLSSHIVPLAIWKEMFQSKD
jgi:predicted nucleic acid-binding protein